MKGETIMKKKIVAIGLVVALCLTTCLPYSAYAKTNGKVKSVKVTNVKNKKLKLKVGQSKKLKVKVVVKGKVSKKVTYKTSNKKVASVTKAGKIKAKKAGTAKITVASKANKKKKVVIKVTVVKKAQSTANNSGNNQNSGNSGSQGTTNSGNQGNTDNTKYVTPSNPVATNEDNDLISGKFTGTGMVDNACGIIKVSADDKGTLTSNSALLVWANRPSEWPSATFMFEDVQDWSNKKTLHVDTKFVNAHNWFGVKLAAYDADNQIVYSNEVGVDTSSSEWCTSVITLSEFTGVDYSKVCGIVFGFNMQDKVENNILAQAYIDNVYLAEDNDLFSTASIQYDCINSTMTIQKTDTYNSKEAVKLVSNVKDGWPAIKVMLSGNENLSLAKSISFDAKMLNVHPWFGIELYDAEGTKVAEIGNDLTAEEWINNEIPIAKFACDSTTLSSVTMMRIVFNFEDNLGDNPSILLDNLKVNQYNLENRGDLELYSGDLLATAMFVYGPAFTDNSENYILESKCEDVSGELSGYSLKLSGTEAASGWPGAQFSLNEKSYDLSNKKLQFDVKFECDGAAPKQWISISLQDSNWQNVIEDYGTDITGEGWHTVTISPSDWKLAEGKDLTDIGLIKFIVDFETNSGHKQAVYIDNLKIIPEN